jgi:hypothetical protein
MPRAGSPPLERKSAFLNIPYDTRFNDLYLAYISGVSGFGLVPRATIEIPGGERRLDRILNLIRSCGYSFHDLSRVEVDRKAPWTPRFNMPFELGLAVSWSNSIKASGHTWFVFESVDRRIQKSLSDLDGTDVYIHGETVDGLLIQLSNALVRSAHQPTINQLWEIFLDLKGACRKLKKDHGASSLYDARMFKELVVLARKSSGIHIPSLSRPPHGGARE